MKTIITHPLGDDFFVESPAQILALRTLNHGNCFDMCYNTMAKSFIKRADNNQHEQSKIKMKSLAYKTFLHYKRLSQITVTESPVNVVSWTKL
jgi:hypothetical protein